MSGPLMPPSLGAALALQSLWLKAWLVVLVGVQVLGVAFAFARDGGRWRLRPEPFAVLASLVAAGISMEWLYAQVGYVRLLGVAHLVCWTPTFLWILSRRRAIDSRSLFGRWVASYLVVVGLSLAIDLVDLVRYLAGEGQLPLN